MARSTPIHLHDPGPGILQLEDDISAPLLAPEHMLAMALDAKGRAEARAANAEIIGGHLTTVVCALIEMLKNNPATEHFVDKGGMVVIPNGIAERVTGMTIEAIETSDGVGVIRRERAPELLVMGDRRG